MIWTALILASYLLGAVSFSLLMVRALKGIDIRTTRSGNAGATNVLRTVGAGPAAAVLALDVAKGVASVLAARALAAPGPVVGAAAVAAVVGHIFPVYFGFRGGKGVATGVGAMATLALRPALLAALAFALVVAATRYVALGSITAAGLFPVLIFVSGRAGWISTPPLWLLVSGTAIALLIIVMHRDNIRRLIIGREHKLGQRESTGEAGSGEIGTGEFRGEAE